MIRLMAAARTTLVVNVWLVGVPAVLIVLAGSPDPGVSRVRAWLVNPLDPRHIHQSGAVLAWTIWLSGTLVVLHRIAQRLAAARWGKLIGYLPAPVQSLAAALLGTAVVATSTSALVTSTASSLVTAADTTDLGTLPAAWSDHIARPAGTQATPPQAVSSRPTDAGEDPAVAARPQTATAGRGHPGAAAARSPAGNPLLNRYRVVPDDNLWHIAATHLGNPLRWRQIYQLNRGHRQHDGYALTDPNAIHTGWTLTLPIAHRAQPATAPSRPAPPSSPPACTSPTATSTSPIPGEGRPADPSQATPATTQTSITSTEASNLPTQASIPSQAAARGADPAGPPAVRDAPRPQPGRATGVDIPGGWITLGLGAGLLTGAATVWARRRHRFRPTSITSPHLDDPDLLPPLAAMTRIRTTLRRAATPIRDEQPTPGPTVREYRAAEVKPELPASGPTGSQLAGAAALPLSAGLGLTGAGAHAAARGLLIATLAAGSDHDPDSKGRAVIAADTLTALLGIDANPYGQLERLAIADSTSAAITALEEEIIRRSRLLADTATADVHTLRDTDAYAEPLPQMLLITASPDPAAAERLAAAVRLAHGVDIGVVVIGDWPTGTTLTVAADGSVGDHDVSRLAVLDAAAALAAIGMLAEAHGGTGHPTTKSAHHETPYGPDPASTSTAVPHGLRHRTARPGTQSTSSPAAVGGLPVTVRVLGHPAVLDDLGNPAPGIRSKALELLVYLAVNRDGASLSDVMEALFPDANMRRASERLSTVAADLRKHIRRAAATPADTADTLRKRLEPIPNTGSRYHLDPALVSVDWWTVLDQYEAVATTTDPGQQLAHLTAALDAIGGPLAEGAHYDWIDTDREVVRRHRLKLHVHAAALLADTDPHQSWLLLEQACQIDPLSDDLARTTMRAAATLGDADAIRHRFKTLREALDAHGLDLSDDTAALARELLRQLHAPRHPE
jgi:DNA-binding SARP family transcriptional activator